jgi:hypothetical protein
MGGEHGLSALTIEEIKSLKHDFLGPTWANPTTTSGYEMSIGFRVQA